MHLFFLSTFSKTLKVNSRLKSHDTVPELICGSMADPNVSNGTCYFTENWETKSYFIPCGNVALSH